MVREIYHSMMRVEDAAELVLNFTKGTPWPSAIICDHDAENRADLEKAFHTLTLGAHKSIAPGIQAVQKRLTAAVKYPCDTHPRKDLGTKFSPGIFYFDSLPVPRTDPVLMARYKPVATVQEYDCYSWDIGKIAVDKYKDLPVDRDNHGMDASRYAVAFVDDIAIDPQEEEHTIYAADEFAEEISLY
jgi:phage terminase large subunit